MMRLPKVIAGTSLLGNLYAELPAEQKKAIVQSCIEAGGLPAVFDSAGKYGAGLALETLGECLRQLGISQDDVIISNKLGWVRVPLQTSEPLFEPGVWKNLQHDAVQNISYEGIIECFHQGNSLLKTYRAQLVSVHDPDEYLAAATDEKDAQNRYAHILDAYRALHDLKKAGQVQQIGIGAKSWKTIQRIANDVALDWVMLANSLTIYHHPPELLSFVEQLRKNGTAIINSAVFHGGFLTGGDYFNYQPVTGTDPAHRQLLHWRTAFFRLCEQYGIRPAEACVYFSTHIPGVSSIALNSSSPERTKQNFSLTQTDIPAAFWQSMKAEKLIDSSYPYL
jgi:D-threo-aldose 1-dehydrogenase